VTSQDKEKYVADFLANEGILLDAEMITPNAAKRALAKLSEQYVGKTYGK
jgi:hypothetical protein